MNKTYKFTEKGLENSIREVEQEAREVLREIIQLEVENKNDKSEEKTKTIEKLESYYWWLIGEEKLIYQNLLLQLKKQRIVPNIVGIDQYVR